MLIDMTNGKRTKTIIIMDSGHIALMAIGSKTIAARVEANRNGAFAHRSDGNRFQDYCRQGRG